MLGDPFDCRRRPLSRVKRRMAQNDEFIREVDEEYRRDQIAKIWKRYNGVIVGVVVLVVAGVGGWRYWEHIQESRAQAAAVRYEEALRLSTEDKGQEAQAAFEALDQGRRRPATPCSPASASRPSAAAERRERRLRLRRSRQRRLGDAALEGSGPPARRLAAPRHGRAAPLRQAAGAHGGSLECLAPFRSGTLRLVRP